MDYYLILASALVVLLVIFLVALWSARKLRSRRIQVQERTETKFREIRQLLAIDTEAAQRMAVIEADKLLDFILKSKGIKGKTLGERLKRSTRLIPNLNQVWFAHKVRNRLVHELESKTSRKEADQIVKIFQAAIKQLVKF